MNCVDGTLSFLTLGGQSEVDHQDGVLFDNADEKNDSDQRHDAELDPENQQCDQRAHAGGW